jgi:tRNA-specific 2-thiouridylase
MRVLVAMSGGVDSSVAAARLIAAGHDVVGVTMKLWGGESDTGCCSVSDVDDARRVAQQLGIAHHTWTFSEDFDRHVVDPYVDAHRRGATPNPCIECNRHLKFDRLLRRAQAVGYATVATGHHARIVTHADGTRRLARGADAAKDQSYVLYVLRQAELSRTLLPVGELTKAEVRAEAAAAGGGAPPGRGRGRARGPRTAHGPQARQPGRVLHHVGPRAARVPRWPDRPASGAGG